MSILEMQRALCKVLTDQQCMQQFLLDKSLALEEFALSNAERKAIEGISTYRLKQYSGILIANRLDLALKAIPRTRKMLGDSFIHEHGYSYGDQYPPIPSTGASPVMTEFRNLLHFLEELIANGRITPPLFQETLRYEATMFILGNDCQVAELVEQFERDYRPLPESPGVLDCKPLRSPGTVLHAFVHEISAPNGAIICGHVLFHKKSRDSIVRLIKLTPAISMVVEKCDGRTNLREIVANVCRQFGESTTDEYTEQCVIACRMLSSRNVLGILSTKALEI